MLCMAKNTSVLIGDHFEAFIGEQVRSGRFASASEVIREALRRLEKDERRVDLIELLEEGERSGFIENFDRNGKLAELERKYPKK